MKKLLITGGAGFIGSNFIRHILNKYKDCSIINLDKLTYCGNLENLKDIARDKRYKFVEGDIADDKLVKEIIKDRDIVVNFAAETHVDRSIIDPYNFVRTNVTGTHVLLEAAKAKGIERFVQVSTDEVYGSIDKGSFRETDPLLPNSPYSASKAGADLLARSYFITFKLPVIITRSSNNFGPYQYPEKVIPLFITNALEDKSLPLYADGMNVRDWLFVLDNCEAIDAVLHKGTAGEVYNIGGGTEITNLELTGAILDILGKDKSLIKFVNDRPGHDKRYSLDITKIRSLGWAPKHDFRSSLELTVNWYKNNEEWWRRLAECWKSIKY
ncbi:MAG: dTDP-glucose 4,6-dehydratase [Candidatus Omnitrophica bacterium]|nr:dTDP-glucose 4,6-dehydratase [Candidatus Omnitrophota bacterium]